MTAFHQHADTIYQKLLHLEEHASDEQLFTCSYLLGHISLVSACEGDSAEQFEIQVIDSLNEAYKVDSLSEQDKTEINALWQQLIQA